MGSEWIGIAIGIVLTVGTGLFVASEFALVNLDRAELEQRQGRGEKRLGLTIKALKITSTHLSSAQLGITLTTLLAGYTFEPAISSLLRGPMLSWGVPESAISSIGAVVAIVVATLFSMIIGELVPKNFALALPLATAKVVVPFQVAFTFVFKPVILLFNNTANAVIRAIGIEPKEELSGARTAEELSFLVRRSAMEGMLDRDDAAMLHRTLTFSNHTANEVMTPRVRLTVLESTATAAEVIEVADSSGRSRFPVIGTGIDDIVGVVHVKTAFGVEFERRDQVTVGDLMSTPLKVPEQAGVGALLGKLRGRGYQIAVVIDEHGGTAGIVTLEDLVEELIGELHDEHDARVTNIVVHGDSVLLSGALRPDELLQRAAIRVPESEDYETVAGYVIDHLERIPNIGDEVALERGTLRVERMTGSRVERLRYLPTDLDSDPAFGGTHERVLEQFEKGHTHE